MEPFLPLLALALVIIGGYAFVLVFGTTGRRLRKRLRVGRPARVDVQFRGAARDFPAEWSPGILVLNTPLTLWRRNGGYLFLGERGARVVGRRRRVIQLADGDETHVVLRIDDRYGELLEVSIPERLEPLVSAVVERALGSGPPARPGVHGPNPTDVRITRDTAAPRDADSLGTAGHLTWSSVQRLVQARAAREGWARRDSAVDSIPKPSASLWKSFSWSADSTMAVLGAIVGMALLALGVVLALAPARSALALSAGPAATTAALAGETTFDAEIPFVPVDVEVSFLVDGRTIATSVPVHDVPAPGSSIRVEYAPSDPARARVVGDPGFARALVIGTALVVAGLGVVLGTLLHSVRVTRRLRRLRSETARPVRYAMTLGPFEAPMLLLYTDPTRSPETELPSAVADDLEGRVFSVPPSGSMGVRGTPAPGHRLVFETPGGEAVWAYRVRGVEDVDVAELSRWVVGIDTDDRNPDRS